MMTLIPIILEIVRDGVRIWSEERRARFMKKHESYMNDLGEAIRDSKGSYSDSKVDLLQEKFNNFLTAYHSELKEEGVKK